MAEDDDDDKADDAAPAPAPAEELPPNHPNLCYRILFLDGAGIDVGHI